MDAGIARYTAYWYGATRLPGEGGAETGPEGRFGLVWLPSRRFQATRRAGNQGWKPRGPPLFGKGATPGQNRGHPMSEKEPPLVRKGAIPCQKRSHTLGGQRGRRWSDKGPLLFPPGATPFLAGGRPFGGKGAIPCLKRGHTFSERQPPLLFQGGASPGTGLGHWYSSPHFSPTA